MCKHKKVAFEPGSSGRESEDSSGYDFLLDVGRRLSYHDLTFSHRYDSRISAPPAWEPFLAANLEQQGRDMAVADLKPSKDKPKLLEQLRAAIRTRHNSIRTEDAYVQWVKTLCAVSPPILYQDRFFMTSGSEHSIYGENVYARPETLDKPNIPGLIKTNNVLIK
ncbi:MAG: hypothetical protein ACE5G1_14175 [bacterium]